MNQSLPVAFYVGHEVTFKTRTQMGRAFLDAASIRIYDSETKTERAFAGENMRSVALFRPYRVGCAIKLDMGSEHLFVAVTRLTFGQGALINYRETLRLFNALSAMSAGPSTSQISIPRGLSKARRFAIFLIYAFAGFMGVVLLSFAKRYWS